MIKKSELDSVDLANILDESIFYTLKMHPPYNEQFKYRTDYNFLLFDPKKVYKRITESLRKIDLKEQLVLFQQLPDIIEEKKEEYVMDANLIDAPEILTKKLKVSEIFDKLDTLKKYINNYEKELFDKIESEKINQPTLIGIKKDKENNKKNKKSEIEKITWNKSKEQLDKLFYDLRNDGFIGDYSMNIVYQNIKVKNSEIKKISEDDVLIIYEKIKWIKPRKMTMLVFLFDYLEHMGAITMKGNVKYLPVCKIFCKNDGGNFDPHNLSQTSINLLDHVVGKFDSYPDFRKLIDENIK